MANCRFQLEVVAKYKMDKQYTIFTSRDKPERWIIYLSFNFLFGVIEESEIQIARIESELGKARPHLKTLFADIHFFLVTVSNIRKMILRLRKLLSKNKDYVFLYKKHINQIKHLNLFRDHLEHFNERLDGVGKKRKPLLRPDMLGNLFGYEYDFGGEKFNLKSAFEIIKKLKSDLIKWNGENYQFRL